MERLERTAQAAAIAVIAVTVSLAMMAGANWIWRHSCCPITQDIARERLGFAAPRTANAPVRSVASAHDASPGDSP